MEINASVTQILDFIIKAGAAGTLLWTVTPKGLRWLRRQLKRFVTWVMREDLDPVKAEIKKHVEDDEIHLPRKET